MVHILTHNDLDGYAAGYIVSNYFGDKEQVLTNLDYNTDYDLSLIHDGDTVIITDYSLPNEQLSYIIDKIGINGELIWCDHHISAIERFKNSGLIVNGIRSTRFCGAALTWLFFYSNITDDTLDTYNEDDIVEMLPKWVRLVDAWDSWKTESKYREDAESLNTYIGSQLSISNIAELAESNGILQYYIDCGKMYMDYRNHWSKLFRDKYAFEGNIDGIPFGNSNYLKCAVLNIGCANSTYFGELIDECDVCITQCFNGTCWTISIYSNKDYVDCSKAAKEFGGGGHKGASGCTFKQIKPPLYISGNGIIKFEKEK